MAAKDSTNIRVTKEAQEIANELSAAADKSAGEITLLALKYYRERMFWASVNSALAARTPEQVAADDAITATWSATMSDGLR